MNYRRLLMAEVHCSMETLLLKNSGDEEPTTPFCAFYKEGKEAGGTNFPRRSPEMCTCSCTGVCTFGVWASHTLRSMRITLQGGLVKMQVLTQ